MALFTKPTYNIVWAETGTKIAPELAKIRQGWVVEIPPFEMENWSANRQDQMLAHINQHGIVEWDNTVEYYANKSYVQGASGLVYRAVKTHTGFNPDIDILGNWQLAFDAAGTALMKAQNLADVPDKALARQNLGISTTSDYDTRYNVKSQNLADVPNKATARNNLDIHSKQEVIDLINALQPAGEVSAFATQSAPSGWLICDGATVSRTTYSRLFAAIGVRFGAGNGSTTFQLPDLRGEFIRGLDGGRGVDFNRVLGSLQSDDFKSHNHPLYDPGHGHNFYVEARAGDSAGGGAITGGRLINGVDATYYGVTSPATTGVTISAAGGGETRPRNIALLYCIRT